MGDIMKNDSNFEVFFSAVLQTHVFGGLIIIIWYSQFSIFASIRSLFQLLVFQDC